MTDEFTLFDAHFHIIDDRFPLAGNNGFVPDFFSVSAYRERTRSYTLAGGALVSGSFQGFDQTYLVAGLKELGPDYVGVTQLPETVADEEVLSLDRAGVKGVRFNFKRGVSSGLDDLERFAGRLHRLAGWHVELYIDARQLSARTVDMLAGLPLVSICHLGLSGEGFSSILELVRRGVYVKATGFGRVDFNVRNALQEICAIREDRLMFGTDLPCTRVDTPFSHDDVLLVVDALGKDLARKVFYDNARRFYLPGK